MTEKKRNMGEFVFVRPEPNDKRLERPCYVVKTKAGDEIGIVFNNYHPDPKPGRPYKKVQRWYALGVKGEFANRREAAEELARQREGR